MKKVAVEEVEETQETIHSNLRRIRKTERKKIMTILEINNSIQGDSIEQMLERIREGEGEEGIPDRDLVYNDNESKTVNPITNIRTDKFESMLEEKIGQYEYQHKKIDRTKEAEKKKEEGENQEEKTTGTEE